jgi:hypothetical protein
MCEYAECVQMTFCTIAPSPTHNGVKTFAKTQFVFCIKNGILLPKLFWPTVRKNCSSDQEHLLKFEAEGREFSKNLRSLEQFIQTEER